MTCQTHSGKKDVVEATFRHHPDTSQKFQNYREQMIASLKEYEIFSRYHPLCPI